MAQTTTSNRMQIYAELDTLHHLEDLLKIQQAMKDLDFGNNPRFEQADAHALIILDTLLAKARQEQAQALEATNFKRALDMADIERSLGISVHKPGQPVLRDPLAIAQEQARKMQAEKMIEHEPPHLAQPSQQQANQHEQTEPTPGIKRKVAITTSLDEKSSRAEGSAQAQKKLSEAESTKKDKIAPKVARDARTVFAKRRAELNPSGPKKKQ